MSEISVLASGMVTSVGFNAAASLAAMRARIRNVRETNLWDETTGTYVAAGKVDLPHWWVGLGKLAELLAPAVSECLAAAAPVTASEVPILLLLAPPSRPHRTPLIEVEMLDELAHRLGVRLHPNCCVFCGDRAATIAALEYAGQLIVEGRARYCVVAGVDSFLDQGLVEHYINRRRILTSDNSNGFSPGEAACAVLVGTDGHPFPYELRILGWGSAREPATIESEEPLRAEGLTEAIRRSLESSRLDIAQTNYRITDLNGEHYKFKEMALAMLRFERVPRPLLYELWHPIEYVGEVGTAVGPMILSVALHAGMYAYGVGPTALCTLSNDDGERACIVTQFRELRATA